MRGFVEQAQRAILARKNPWLASGVILTGVACSTYFRIMIDRGANGFLFSGYFPIILLAAILCGWHLGIFATIASLAAMQIAFSPPFWSTSDNLGPSAILMAFLATIALVLFSTEMLRMMLFRFDAQAKEFAEFNAELIHRNKNALQVLIGYIHRGLREKDIRPYFEALPQRLSAWAQASEFLRFGARPDCAVADLVNLAIKPFNRDRFDISGCDVAITGKCATALSMILHELGTNATKYGALGVDGGRVLLVWAMDEGFVKIRWEERFGPPVEKPTRRGFGSIILQRQSDLEKVEIDYARSGVVAVIWMRGVD